MGGPPTLGLALLETNVRRMTMRIHGGRIARAGIDAEDVIQDVFMGILQAQHRPRSRWDPERGASETSYLFEVVRTAGFNSLRKHARWSREEPVKADPSGAVPDLGSVPAHESEAFALNEILTLLDLPEEQDMARLLAAGCSIADAGRRLNLTESAASELGTRVRALLLPLREGA